MKKPIDPPYKAIEFSSREWGTVIATFAVNLQVMLKGVPKSRRYRMDLKMYQVTRERKKAKNEKV